jgi:hypothetical protein
MRRVAFGLALMSLMMCGSTFAADAPSADSNGSQEVRKPSPTPQGRHPNTKRVSVTPSDGRAAPQSLPLSSAASYAAEHSASLPITSVPKPAPSPGNSWTGFYLGAGAGVGTTQP